MNKLELFFTLLDPRYWNFGFVEVGRYDLPAMINYILNVTNKSELLLPKQIINDDIEFLEK